jgi:hypothetical protein
MRTITLQVIREHGCETRVGIQIDGRLTSLMSLAPDEVGTFVQGFIAALPPLED